MATTLSEMIVGKDIHSIHPDDTVRLACVSMTSLGVGALPVIERDGRLVGMLSERDVIRRSVIVYRNSEDTPVAEIMTRDPVTLPPEASPQEALDAMQLGGFRHLPICTAGGLIGIVSLRDFILSAPGAHNRRRSDLIGASIAAQ